MTEAEQPEHRLKRLRMRSWRRGTKEMDMILGPFSDTALKDLSPDMLDRYEALLEENDQDLYAWVAGRDGCPPELVNVLKQVKTFHDI